MGGARLWRGRARLWARRLCPRGLFRLHAVNAPVSARASSYARRTRYSGRVRRTNRETAMPEIYVHAVKGRSLEQKRALIKDITDAVVKNFSVPAEVVMVEIVESEPTAKAKGGVLFSEMRR
ncbi:MAG TPA: tautomerase family protein [Xanthobacteraceae bacterium]|nr:tautomerase family protein [Xanthobacteraceae bacterium]